VFSNLPREINVNLHCIKLTEEEKQVRSRAYQLPNATKETLKGKILEMLKLGITQESNLPYASPIVLGKKDGSTWLCVNYRQSNRITVTDP